jgi:Na+/proline symporter
MNWPVVIVFLLYVGFVYYVGFKGYQRVHSAEDLIVAGWDMPLPVVTGSLVAALLAAPFFFAAVGSGYNTGGWEATATMAGLGSCMVLGAFIWTRPLRRLKGWTIADYYGLRFADKKLGAYCGAVMGIAFGVFNAGALTVGGTYILMTIFNLPFWAAAVIFIVLTAIYSTIGGLWAVAYTEIVQGALALIGIISMATVVFLEYRGQVFDPSWWDIGHLFRKGGATFWTLYLVLALGDIPAADLGQRVCGARNPRVASLSMVIAGLIVMGISWIPGMLGEAFKTIFPNHPNPERLMLIFAEAHFPPIVAGLFLTAMAAMGMSTLSACYVASAGVWIKNIYLDLINPKADPDKLLRLSRYTIAASAVLALILALGFQKVIDLAYLAWDIVFVTLFWPLVLGPFWSRVNSKAVWASVTGGIIAYVLTSVFGVPALAVSSEGFLGLLAEMWSVPVFASVTIAGVIIVVVSLMFPASEAELEAHRRERTPTPDELGKGS